jgi:hypothetical protein
VYELNHFILIGDEYWMEGSFCSYLSIKALSVVALSSTLSVESLQGNEHNFSEIVLPHASEMECKHFYNIFCICIKQTVHF